MSLTHTERERVKMPAVSKGDGMRGLAVFISDIRNCEFSSSAQLFFNLTELVPVSVVYRM